jgi:hypothetical protein
LDSLHQPYFNDFNDLICLILQNHIPLSIQNVFSANYFVAFHKDPDNCKPIRPLCSGTTLCHLAGSLIVSIFHNKIIQYLLPDGQFGLAVPGGTDFAIQSAQSLIN